MALTSSLPIGRVERGATNPYGRIAVIGLTSFLTLVDLFATQAILPSLAMAYAVSPATMGVAVNASTIGMAVAGLAVALFGRRIDRRLGVCICLALLAIPTLLLAVAPDLAVFTVLRVCQGVFMAAAFTLTMAYLAERAGPSEVGGLLAAYVTGNVASNLFGRMISAYAADLLGLSASFGLFAGLNLAGAALVYFGLGRCKPAAAAHPRHGSAFAAWAAHLRTPPLLASFGIGFSILFAFIGTFTYVNFVLARQPFGLSPMSLGLVYLVFLPSLLTTPLAGRAARRFGVRASQLAALATAGAGLPLTLIGNLPALLAGLVLVAAGTFFAQALATGFVAAAARVERGAASGLYLASYYLGGLAGSAILGRLFDGFGWAACTAGIGFSLLAAAVLAVALRPTRDAG